MKANQKITERDKRGTALLKKFLADHPQIADPQAALAALTEYLYALPNPQVIEQEIEDSFTLACQDGKITLRDLATGRFVDPRHLSADDFARMTAPQVKPTAKQREQARLDAMSADEYAREFPPEMETSPRDVGAVKQAMATVLQNYPQIMLSGPEGRSNIRKFQQWFDCKRVSTQAAKNCIEDLLAKRELMTDSTLAPTQTNVTRYVRGEGHPEPIAVIAMTADGDAGKNALRAEIKRMNADEFRERLSSDETFAEAVNKL